MSKPKYSAEIKIMASKRYLAGESSTTLAAELSMSKYGSHTILDWAAVYQEFGENGFFHSTCNNTYTKEFKQQVIDEYLNGGVTYRELARKYNISEKGIVRSWVNKYNNGIEIKDYSPNNEVYTMKFRKTTFDERLEIVRYVLTNDNNYKDAADKYSVPYANVYQWVMKYKKSGEEGLFDRRGKKASVARKYVLTTEEKKDIEIEKLKRELERANMVIEVLKKKHKLEEQFEKDSRSFAKNFRTKQSKNSK